MYTDNQTARELAKSLAIERLNVDEHSWLELYEGEFGDLPVVGNELWKVSRDLPAARELLRRAEPISISALDDMRKRGQWPTEYDIHGHPANITRDQARNEIVERALFGGRFSWRKWRRNGHYLGWVHHVLTGQAGTFSTHIWDRTQWDLLSWLRAPRDRDHVVFFHPGQAALENYSNREDEYPSPLDILIRDEPDQEEEAAPAAPYEHPFLTATRTLRDPAERDLIE